MLLANEVLVEGGVILVVVAGAAGVSWHRRRVARWATSELTSVDKITSSLIVGRFGERRCRIEFRPDRRGAVTEGESSFVLVAIASGSTVPFRALRQHGSIAYDSTRPERFEEMRHSGEIEALLESLLETADSVEVAGRISVRFCPFKEEYLDPFALRAILEKAARLATALDDDAVRAGVSQVEVDRSRSQLEARMA
jgi:hypothetical protein